MGIRLDIIKNTQKQIILIIIKMMIINIFIFVLFLFHSN